MVRWPSTRVRVHAKSASLRVGVRVRVRVISFWGRVCVMIFFKKKNFLGKGVCC